MKTIKINIDSNSDFNSAQAKAANQVPYEESSLISWYDRKNKTGGPLEACGDEPHKASQDYARSNGAGYHVSAGNRYEFYYGEVPKGTEQLDPEMLVEVHEDLEFDRYENVQGG